MSTRKELNNTTEYSIIRKRDIPFVLHGENIRDVEEVVKLVEREEDCSFVGKSTFPNSEYRGFRCFWFPVNKTLIISIGSRDYVEHDKGNYIFFIREEN